MIKGVHELARRVAVVRKVEILGRVQLESVQSVMLKTSSQGS